MPKQEYLAKLQLHNRRNSQVVEMIFMQLDQAPRIWNLSQEKERN